MRQTRTVLSCSDEMAPEENQRSSLYSVRAETKQRARRRSSAGRILRRTTSATDGHAHELGIYRPERRAESHRFRRLRAQRREAVVRARRGHGHTGLGEKKAGAPLVASSADSTQNGDHAAPTDFMAQA